MTNTLNSALGELLSEYLPSFSRKCPSQFPRIEYELKQISALSIERRYILTLNAYDRGTAETIENVIDSIELDFGEAEYKLNNGTLKIYRNNDRQTMPDTDLSINRINLTFEVKYFIRGEF